MTFIETIKVKEGRFFNLEYHRRRMERTALHFFGTAPELPLDIPVPDEGLFKYRVEYGKTVLGTSLLPYRFRWVHSLRKVDGTGIDYRFKKADRTQLEQLFALRDGCDDVLIISNGWVTDTSIANVVLFDGQGYYTPEHPLLYGTKREQLLEQGKIRKAGIRVTDLTAFERIFLINAMIDLEDNISLPMSAVW